MVDFQYEPDSTDPISMLRRSMHQMDGPHLGLTTPITHIHASAYSGCYSWLYNPCREGRLYSRRTNAYQCPPGSFTGTTD